MERQLDFLALEDRAKEAESLLGHAIFGDAVRALRTTYLAEMEACPIGNAERLALAHVKLRVLADVVSALQMMVADYKIAAKQKAKAA